MKKSFLSIIFVRTAKAIINKTSMSSSTTHSKIFDEGKAAFSDEQYETAIRKFSHCINQSPELAQAYYYRGVCWLKIGAPVSATEDFERAVALNPDLDGPVQDMMQQTESQKKSKQHNNRAQKLGKSNLFPRIRRALTD